MQEQPSPREQHEEFLSPREAGERYDLVVQSLVTRLRNGELAGFKVRGPHGREWRVSVNTLESFGFRPRPRRDDQPSVDPQVAELEATVRELRRKLAFERNRADAADRKLGEAAMTIGHLRAALEHQRGNEERTIDVRQEACPAPRRARD